MQEISLIGFIGAGLFISGAVLVSILIVFLIVMHNILHPRLDPILFREPWFNSAQLDMFSAWPLSLIKSMSYIFLIAYPSFFLNRKRFNGLETVPPVQPSIKTACKVYFILHLSTVIISISLFVFLAWYIIYQG